MASRAATWPPTAQSYAEPATPRTPGSQELDLSLHNAAQTSRARLQPLVARTPVVTPASSSIATAWKAQLNKLSAAERRMFEEHSAGDLTKYVGNLEVIFAKAGQQSKAGKVARLFKPLFETMNLYAPIAQTMIQADPTSAALVLGGITCIISISQRFLTYHEKIVEMLADMGLKLDILMKYGKEIYFNDESVLRPLFAVFMDILEFCRAAWHMFRHEDGEPRSSVKLVFTSLAKTFEMRFGEIITKFEKDLKEFEDRALQADRREAREFQSEVRDFQQEVREHHSSTVIQQTRMVSMAQMFLTSTTQRQIEDQDHHKKRVAEEQRETREKQQRERKEKEEKRAKIISWLPSVEYEKEQEQKFEKNLTGTGAWLLEHPKYLEWKDASISQLLWIQGKHGCGKSHLASVVIQHLKEISYAHPNDENTKRKTALAYVYCNTLNRESLEPSKLLGSLLKQLCHLLPKPSIESSLELLYDRESEVRDLEVKEIKNIIITLLGSFTETYIVVDGLDECRELKDGQFEAICEFFQLLSCHQAESSIVKVMALSRPGYPEIKGAFGECPGFEINPVTNKEDIMQFIATKLSNSTLLKKDVSLMEEVKRDLLSRADGMFLWVDLVVNSLKEMRRPRDLRERIKELPDRLDQVYEDAIGKILNKSKSTKNLALKILLWVTNARRPLQREELLEALSVQSGTREIDKDDRYTDEDVFASDCADLILLDGSGCYQLIHSSLKDYLCETASTDARVPEEYRRLHASAEKSLAETCLTYLNFDIFQTGPVENIDLLSKLTSENPFLAYAAVNWGNHMSLLKEVDDDLRSLAMKFLTSDPRRCLSMQLIALERWDNHFQFPVITTPTHLASIFNLILLVQPLSVEESLTISRDELGYNQIDYAVRFQSKEMCQWLLQKAGIKELRSGKKSNRRHPMHFAARNDWVDVILKLIDIGCPIELATDTRGRTALHVAACKGSEKACVALLDAGADVNSMELNGATPLIDAAEGNHTAICQLLVARGADATKPEWNGVTALHHAAKHGNANIAELLIQQGADIDAISEIGSPLKVAAEHNSFAVLDLLISKGADVGKPGIDGLTALLIACRRGHLECILYLLDNGADITQQTFSEETVLHLAAMSANTGIIKELVQRFPQQISTLMNVGDDAGQTPLHNTAFTGNKNMAEELLKHGACIDALDLNQDSPLHLAVQHGQLELATSLVENYHADASLKNGHGFTMLHCAAFNGLPSMVGLLLKMGVDPSDVADEKHTAIHLAAMKNHVEFATELLKERPELDLAAQTEKGETPLHIAALEGHLEFIDLILSKTESTLQVADCEGDFPIHNSAWKGQCETFEKLCNHENINQCGAKSRSPLSIAAACGHLDLTRFLIANGAKVDTVDEDGDSALSMSIALGNLEIANLLLDHGADPDITGKDGLNALFMATQKEYESLIRRLLDLGCDGLKPGPHDMTPFFLAVCSDNEDLLGIFLGKGISDWNTTFAGGVSLVHILSGTGRLQRLSGLSDHLNATLLHKKDDMGNDALYFASNGGQADMIDKLFALGLRPTNPTTSITPPLYKAASNGYLEATKRLLAHGCDANEKNGFHMTTALHAAARTGYFSTFEALLQGGAVDSMLDAFGLTPYDWAARHFPEWQKLETTQIHEHLTVDGKESALHKAGRSIIHNILDLGKQSIETHTNEFRRGLALEELIAVLLEVNTEQAHEAAVVCFLELRSFQEQTSHPFEWNCDTCHTSNPTGPWYTCRKSSDIGLCTDCYLDYLMGDAEGTSPPRNIKELWELEKKLKPLREVVKSYLWLGIEPLATFWSDNPSKKWLSETQVKYELWQKVYNSNERFKDSKRPGYFFLTLMHNASYLADKASSARRTIAKSSHSNPQNEQLADIEEESLLKELERQLHVHFSEYPPDRELFRFTCMDHDFLEIPALADISSERRLHLDSKGRVTNEWLSDLLGMFPEENEDVRQDISGAIDGDKTVELSDPNPDSRQSKGKIVLRESPGHASTEAADHIVAQPRMQPSDMVQDSVSHSHVDSQAESAHKSRSHSKDRGKLEDIRIQFADEITQLILSDGSLSRFRVEDQESSVLEANSSHQSPQAGTSGSGSENDSAAKDSRKAQGFKEDNEGGDQAPPTTLISEDHLDEEVLFQLLWGCRFWWDIAQAMYLGCVEESLSDAISKDLDPDVRDIISEYLAVQEGEDLPAFRVVSQKHNKDTEQGMQPENEEDSKKCENRAEEVDQKDVL